MKVKSIYVKRGKGQQYGPRVEQERESKVEQHIERGYIMSEGRERAQTRERVQKRWGERGREVRDGERPGTCM